MDAQNRANIFDPATARWFPSGPMVFRAADMSRIATTGRRAWAWHGRLGNRGRVFRAGYGIYYDQGALATGEGLYFNPPYFNFQVYYPLQAMPLFLNNPFPAEFPFPYPPSALAFQRNFRTPYVQQWNFGIQQQVGKNRVVEIAYVGAKGTGLLTARDINQPQASPQQPNPRPNPQFADIDILESARQLDLPQPAGTISAAPDHGPFGAGFLHVVEVDRRRVELLFQRRRSEFSAEQLQRARRARPFELSTCGTASR